MLRHASVAVLSMEAGLEVKLNIHRSLSLRDSGRTGKPPESPGDPPQTTQPDGLCAGSETVDLVQIQADIERIDTAGYHVVSAFESAIVRVEKDFEELKGTVSEIRQNIRSLSNELNSELKAVKAEAANAKTACPYKSKVQELQYNLEVTDKAVIEIQKLSAHAQLAISQLHAELQASKAEIDGVKLYADSLAKEARILQKSSTESTQALEGYQAEVGTLRAELKQVRQEIEQERARRVDSQKGSFSSRELDILTSNIAKIGNRASQIETLQMEIQLFKTRLQRLEAQNAGPPLDARRPKDAAKLDGEGQQPLDTRTSSSHGRKKRASVHDEAPLEPAEGPQKRVAFPLNISSPEASGYAGLAGWEDISSPSTGRGARRGTRAGDGGQRPPRRGTKNRNGS